MIPDFMNHIDVEASKVTTSLLRDIIKKWRQSGLDNLPLDPKQLKSLDKTISEVSEDLEAGRQPVFSNVLEDSGETTVFLVERQGIPLIESCLLDKSGRYIGVQLLLDTGSALNVLRLDILQSLGYDVTDLDTSQKFRIVTASEGSIQGLGIIKLDLFCVAANKKWYRFRNVQCLVISGGRAPDLIIGIEQLRAWEFSWNCKKHKTEEGILLNCENKYGPTRRRFVPVGQRKIPIKMIPGVNFVATDHRVDTRRPVQLQTGTGHVVRSQITLESVNCQETEGWPSQCHYQYSLNVDCKEHLEQNPVFVCQEREDPWACCPALDCRECFTLEAELEKVREEIESERQVPVMYTQNDLPINDSRVIFHPDELIDHEQPEPALPSFHLDLPDVAFGDHNEDVELVFEADANKPSVRRIRVPGESKKSEKIKPVKKAAVFTNTIFMDQSHIDETLPQSFNVTEASVCHLEKAGVKTSGLKKLLDQEAEEERATSGFFNPTQGQDWKNEQYFETKVEERSEIEPPAIGGEKVRGVWIPFTDSVPEELKQQYQDLFVDMAGAISQHKYDLGTYRHQKATAVALPGRICHSAPRTYTTGELEIMKKTCLDLEASGVIARCAERPKFTHSLLFVPKASPQEKLDRTYVTSTREEMVRKHGARLCSDLREVNLSTERMTSAVLPRLQDMLPLLSNKVSVTVDLTSGYFQLSFDEESQELFGFWCQALGTWFKFRKICQGWVNSATYFQYAVQFGLLDESAWEEFLKQVDAEYPGHRLRQLPLVETIINYLDDLTLMQFDYYNLFFVLKFVLLRLIDCNLKLNPAKVTIAGPDSAVEILGITIDNARNMYCLSPARASMISEYKYPMSRIAVRSKLAGLAYFSLVLPGMKNLLFCLGLLAKTKNRFTHLFVHKIEFLALKFLACCKIELTLPDLSKPLYISSDASYSVYSFNSFQVRKIDPELKKYYDTPTPERDNENFLNSSKINQELFRKQSVNGYTVEWTSVYSRSFSAAYLVRAPYHKELIGIYSALVNLESWIRRCPRATLFTDCKAIFLSSLGKETSSKLSSIALFLSSFTNLSVVHTKGNFGMVQMADYMSRVLGDQKIKTPASWDLNKIEDMSDISLPDNLLITPGELQRVMLAALPAQFSAFPSHKRQPQAHLPYYDLFSDLKQFRSETEIVTTMLRGGYEALDKENTVAFRTDGDKPYNKIEFDKFIKATDLGSLKNDLSYVTTHVHHIDRFSDNQINQIRLVMIRLRDYFAARSNIKLTPGLRQQMEKFCQAPSVAQLVPLVGLLMEQPWFRQNCLNDVLPAELVLVSPHLSCAAELSVQDRALLLGFKEDRTLIPGAVFRLQLGINIKTRCKFDIKYTLGEQLQIVMVQSKTGHGYCLDYLMIVNVSPESHLVTARQELCRVVFQTPELLCQCTGPGEVILLVDYDNNEPLDTKDSITDAARELFYVFHLANMPNWRRFIAVDFVQDNAVSLFFSACSSEVNETHIIHNKLVILSRYLTDNRTFSKHTICQIQSNDPEISQILNKLRNGTHVKGFVIKSGLLFKVEMVGDMQVHALCLDEVMTQMLCESLHVNNLHYSDRVVTEMMRRMFFHSRLKAIVRRVSKSCSACAFTQPSFQRNYIGRQLHDPPRRGQIMQSDLSESHSTDKKGYRFVLVVTDQKTSFTLYLPLKQKSSREVARHLNQLFAWWKPEKFVSDYASCYRGEVSQVLRRFHVVHEKSTVSRPEGNASAERLVKLGRDFLRKCLLNLPQGRYDVWSEYLPLITALFNQGLTAQLRLSRHTLFFGADFYHSPHFLHIQPEVTDHDFAHFHSSSLESLDRAREDQRRRLLAASGPDQFILPENSLVLHVPDKHFQTQQRLPGDFPTSFKVFRVLSQTQTGARLYNLATGDVVNIDKKKLVLLTDQELLKCLPLDSGLKGSFQKGIFTPGDGKMILADIYKSSEEGYLQALVEERLRDRGLDEAGRPPEDDTGTAKDPAREEEGDEETHLERNTENQSREEETLNIDDSEFHRLRQSGRYSLRPRKPVHFMGHSQHFGFDFLTQMFGCGQSLL